MFANLQVVFVCGLALTVDQNWSKYQGLYLSCIRRQKAQQAPKLYRLSYPVIPQAKEEKDSQCRLGLYSRNNIIIFHEIST